MTPTECKVEYTTNAGDKFLLRVEIPEYYPAEMPSTYVEFPKPLLKKNGDLIKGYSSSFHTYGDKNGEPRICVGRPDAFDESETIYYVLIKSFTWLEALSQHWVTGKDLGEYLSDQPRKP